MMRHRNFLLTSVLLAILAIAVPVLAQEVLKPTPMSPISISGEHIVWAAVQNENWDIYYYNTRTKETKNLSQNPYDQIRPNVWGNYVVWEDHRNNPESDFYSDIYLHNLVTGETKQINKHHGFHKEPIISNNKAVWVDHQKGTHIYLYDILTDTQTLIHDGMTAFTLQFDGQVIAWTDFRDGDADIYAYDLAFQQEARLSGTRQEEIAPLVGNGLVIWSQPENNDAHLYTYNFQDKIIRRITAGIGQHEPLSFDGQTLVLKKDGRLYLNQKPNVSVQAPITLSIPDPTQILIQGSDIIYLKDGHLYQTTIAQVLAEPPLPVTTSGASFFEPAAKKRDHTKEHHIQSPDGLLTLTIKPYTFSQDFTVTITEQEFIPANNFKNLTPMYLLQTEQQPSQGVITTVKYSLDKDTQLDLRTISLYQQAGNTWAYLPGKQEPAKELITTEITNLNPLTLMSFTAHFNDLQDHWGEEAILIVAAHHIINGYPDGTFRPNASITRAEFIKVLVNISGETLVEPLTSSFTDVTADHWAYPYVETAYAQGWVQGYRGQFNPAVPITREEMVTMLMRALKDNLPQKLQTVNLTDFKDAHTISPWAEEHLNLGVATGLILGANQQLDPKGLTTRAAAATVIYRYLTQSGRF